MPAAAKSGLQVACTRGEPLADFTTSFADGLDCVDLTERLNQLADDLFVHERPWYDVPTLRGGRSDEGRPGAGVRLGVTASPLSRRRLLVGGGHPTAAVPRRAGRQHRLLGADPTGRR
jgi:hypothetical protein